VATSERDDKYPNSTGGYRHLRFSFVSVPGYHGASEASAKHMRNEIDTPLYHLELTSQGDQFRPDELYGYGAEYRGIHSLDLREVQAYARFLTTLHQRLDRLQQQLGPVEHYTNFVVRVAQVLRCRYLIVKASADRSGWSDYAAGDYEVTPLYQSTTKGLRDELDGYALSSRVHTLTYQLWTEADRAAAKEYTERKAAEDAARKAADAS
jgi:hypothetical protein